jgi:hypothetical protein
MDRFVETVASSGQRCLVCPLGRGGRVRPLGWDPTIAGARASATLSASACLTAASTCDFMPAVRCHHEVTGRSQAAHEVSSHSRQNIYAMLAFILRMYRRLLTVISSSTGHLYLGE